MDLETLVDETRPWLDWVEKTHGPVALFMLVADDIDPVMSWTLYLSAKGYDGVAGQAQMDLFEFQDTLSPNVRKQIRNARVLDTDDPFVKEAVFTFGSQKPIAHVQSWQIAGVQLPRAMVLEAKKIAA